MGDCIVGFLAGISPIYQSTNEYVANQRLEHFTELANVVEAMRIVPKDKKNCDTYKYVMMYLIEEKSYMLNFEQIFETAEALLCYDIVEVVCKMNLSKCDTYWVSRNFTTLVRQKVHPEISCLVRFSINIYSYCFILVLTRLIFMVLSDLIIQSDNSQN